MEAVAGTARTPMAPGLLLARAFTVSAAATSSAILAHTSAGGLLPSPLVLVALWTAGALVAVPWLTGPAGALRLTMLVVAGQLGGHLVMSATAGHVHSTHAHLGPQGSGELGMTLAHAAAAAAPCGT